MHKIEIQGLISTFLVIGHRRVKGEIHDKVMQTDVSEAPFAEQLTFLIFFVGAFLKDPSSINAYGANLHSGGVLNDFQSHLIFKLRVEYPHVTGILMYCIT